MPQSDPAAAPIIWGHCIVHLSNPEFCGHVLHTSGVLALTEHKNLLIAETRNNLYALLGPELQLPADRSTDPQAFVLANLAPAPKKDAHINAAMNADPACPLCHGAGVHALGADKLAICERCCKHNQGWWLLEGAYGADNGRWACKAGCGFIVDKPPPVLEFLPRARS